MNTNEIATKQDLRELAKEITDKLTQFETKITAADQAKSYTINQLKKMKKIGGHDRIKSLIKKGIIKTLPDGRISQAELDNYFNLMSKPINPKK